MLATEECKKMPEKHDEKWITLFRTVNIIWFWKCTQKWNIPSFLAFFIKKKKKFYLGYTGWGGDQSAIERLETSCLQSIPKCWLLMLPTAEAESQRRTDATEHVQFNTHCHSFSSNIPSIQKHGNELGFSLTLKGLEGSSLRSENLKHAAHYLQLRERAEEENHADQQQPRFQQRSRLGPHCPAPAQSKLGLAPSPPSLRFVYKWW